MAMKFNFIWMEIQSAIHSKGLKLNNSQWFLFAFMRLKELFYVYAWWVMDEGSFLKRFELHVQAGIYESMLGFTKL